MAWEFSFVVFTTHHSLFTMCQALWKTLHVPYLICSSQIPTHYSFLWRFLHMLWLLPLTLFPQLFSWQILSLLQESLSLQVSWDVSPMYTVSPEHLCNIPFDNLFLPQPVSVLQSGVVLGIYSPMQCPSHKICSGILVE